MFGSIKKAVAVGAVVAVGAFAAPAMASADHQGVDTQWNPPVTATSAPGDAVTGTGALSLYVPAVNTTVTCGTVTAAGGLWNGTTALGRLSSLGLNDCTSTQPGCSVNAASDFSDGDWGLLGSADFDGIEYLEVDGIQFTNTYSGEDCVFDGVSLTFTGNITGVWDDATSSVTFASTPGLSHPVYGPALVSGTVALSGGVTQD